MRYGNKIIQGNTSPRQTKAELVEQIKTMNHNYQVLHEQHERGYTYSIKTIRDLESKLEIARKALEVATDALSKIDAFSCHRKGAIEIIAGMTSIANRALYEITSITKKD